METSIKHVELVSGNGINIYCAPESVLLLKNPTNGMANIVHLQVSAKIQLSGTITNVLLQPPQAPAISLFPEASSGITQMVRDEVRAGGDLHISFPCVRKLLFAE